MSSGLIRYLTDKNCRVRVNAAHGFYKSMPDEDFLKLYYKARIGKELDLEHPKTFNEKMQWLKLHDRNPLYSTLVDKYAVKEYVAERIGQEHVIPIYGVWDRFEDIDFDKLPDRFVLKCTHDSGGLVICKDKKTLDRAKAKKKIDRCLKRDYYSKSREWPYTNVPHRVIAEQYMEDGDGTPELTDYKIYCFGGKPKVIQVITNRYGADGMINDHYTLDWEKLDLTRSHYASKSKPVPRPPEIDEILKYAEILAKGTYFVRADFYIVDHNVYFGELTFYPSSGFNAFHPEKWDRIFGDWIRLPIDETENEQ